jgi:exodeoxyribonuclease V alpha subunit
MITIEGYISKQIYANGDFKIYSFFPLAKYIDMVKLDPRYGNMSISGSMPDMYEEVLYKIDLEYSKKGKYDNYDVTKIYSTNKVDANITNKFLYSILTKTQAEELLKHYPDIVNMIIKNKPIDTKKLHGIKDKTMNIIKRKVVENFKLVELVEEYSEYGMTFTMMKNLYEAYSSVDMIKQKMEADPYTCLCKLNRVGFKTADKFIMNKFPQKINSIMRATACIDFIISDNENNGNTWISLVELYRQFKELAPEANTHFNDVISRNDEIYFNNETKRVANIKTYICEKEVCNKILAFKSVAVKSFDFDYRKYNEVEGCPITEEQTEILRNVCNDNLNLLVGYGGTGKTFSTKALINMLDDNMITYILMSPTGKASKVLARNSGRSASTIHRGLAYNPKEGFQYNENNKLPYDVIIIDEYSMIDIFLMRDLLRAIGDETKIVFIGDPAQIPSVSMGNVAFDMLQSNKLTTASLTKVFRYGEGGLSYVATKVRNGERYLDDSKAIQTYGSKKDYTFVNTPQDNTIKCVQSLYLNLLKKGATIDDIMVLTAMNKGEYGTNKINAIIQELVNPKTKDTKEVIARRMNEEMIFRLNDKVMQIKNNYKAIDISAEDDDNEVSVFNGDTGIIIKVDKDTITVNFEGKIIIYERGDLDQLNLAYALTIHKSQGSASKYVLLVTPKAHKFFLDRNLLYVAVTRAENSLYHIGTVDVVDCALVKSQNFSRNTFLQEMLTENKDNKQNIIND